MSDSAVHEELEELDQENTVGYFSIARKQKSIVFSKIEMRSNFTLKGEFEHTRSAIQTKKGYKLSFISSLVSQDQTLGCKRKGKTRKGRPRKSVAQVCFSILFTNRNLTKHGIKRGFMANDGCDHIALTKCCFSDVFLTACYAYLGSPDLQSLNFNFNYYTKKATSKIWSYCHWSLVFAFCPPF